MGAFSGGALRSFTLLEILDRTFRIYRENFLAMIGLVAVINIPLTIVSTLNTLSNPGFSSSSFGGGFSSGSSQLSSGTDFSSACLLPALTILLSIIQVVVVNAVLTYMASESHLGRKASIGEAFSAIRHRLTKVGCGLVLFYLILIALAFGIGVGAALCTPALAVFGVWIYIGVATYAFLIPILTLEEVNISFGVNRSWGLGKSRFWSILGLIVVITILSLVLTASLTAVSYLLLFQMFSTGMTEGALIVQTVLSTIINILVAPLTPIALTLLYYDTRVRLEGLDIAFSAVDTPEPRPADVASPRPGAFLESRDWVNMLIVVGVTFVVGLIFYQAFQSLLGPEFNSLFENFAR